MSLTVNLLTEIFVIRNQNALLFTRPTKNFTIRDTGRIVIDRKDIVPSFLQPARNGWPCAFIH